MDRKPTQEPSPFPLPPADSDCSLGLVGELWRFVRATGKWWLVPVLIALLLLGAMVVLSGTWYAPFIYTLF
jgi:hypothetical protein